MRMDFGTQISNPYVLSMASNGKSKLTLTSTQDIYIFMDLCFTHSCSGGDIKT